MSTAKRPAPRTPEGRPAKRRATSSPEEGELDDSNDARTPPSSTTPTDPNPKFKVPFPFKNKNNNSLLSRIGGMSEVNPNGRSYSRERNQWDYEGEGLDGGRRRPPAVYERHEEFDDRLRHGHASFGNDRRIQGRRGIAGDHYEPSYASERRDSVYGFHRERNHDRRQADRESSYCLPRQEAPEVAPVSLQSSARSVSSCSASRSRSRSRSISPQVLDRKRRRHRLPSPRSTFIVSPVRSDYRHGYNDDRYEPCRRDMYRDRENNPRGQYQTGGLDDYDRYYRPGGSYDSKRGREVSHYSRSPLYQPASPPKTYAKLTPEPRPSPPSISTSQKYARDAASETKPEETLRAHEAIVFALRRPGAPRNESSPPPLIETMEKTTPAPPSVSLIEKSTSTEPNITSSAKLKRVPVKRTREEEKLAYRRAFVGCGDRDDYDVLTKLGEGTFGEVHRALHKKTGSIVALKRILMHNEKDGMPVTALREIKILKALKHPCIVDLIDMFVVRGNDTPMSVYMVFPYMDHDLAGLLENERVKLSPSQIKLYMKQLLEGTEYMHHNNVVHRDMKAANLLISNNGSLKIADFGLARPFDPSIAAQSGRDRRYTNCVVTRWYRPPELLLGARHYGGEIDIWGIGCVLGEMIMRRPILPGTSDIDQLDKIWSICGSPNQQNWPDYDKLPGCGGQIRFEPRERRVKQVYDSLGKETSELMDRLLTLDPRERITASDALDHEYFWSDPLPADPKSLPSYEASHELDQRGRYRQTVLQNDAPKPAHRPFAPAQHVRLSRNEDGRQQTIRMDGPAPPYGQSHYPWTAAGPTSVGANRPMPQGVNYGATQTRLTGMDRNVALVQRHQTSHLPLPPPGLPTRPGAMPRPLGKRPVRLPPRNSDDAPPFLHGGSLNYG